MRVKNEIEFKRKLFMVEFRYQLLIVRKENHQNQVVSTQGESCERNDGKKSVDPDKMPSALYTVKSHSTHTRRLDFT